MKNYRFVGLRGSIHAAEFEILEGKVFLLSNFAEVEDDLPVTDLAIASDTIPDKISHDFCQGLMCRFEGPKVDQSK